MARSINLLDLEIRQDAGTSPGTLVRDIERVRRNHHDALRDIQKRRVVTAEVIEGVELADATNVLVAHGLGRPAVALVSSVRDATGAPSTSGSVIERKDADANPDPNKYVVLNAAGWGGTVYVDVVVL